MFLQHGSWSQTCQLTASVSRCFSAYRIIDTCVILIGDTIHTNQCLDRAEIMTCRVIYYIVGVKVTYVIYNIYNI